LSTKSCSFVFAIGAIQSKIPGPIFGGACLLSACFARGAYTTLLYGRRRQKARETRIVRPSEVPSEA
jgi:hypothetical protein